MRILIRRLKYGRQREIAEILAQTMAAIPYLPTSDVITAVPVATGHYRSRGYNQAELIARYLARKLALPYRPLLYRNRNTQQVGRSRTERLSNVTGTFMAREQPPSRVLLVDDVMTTGATLNACAAALKSAGAQAVWGAVTARD
jgi:ComF family protein